VVQSNLTSILVTHMHMWSLFYFNGGSEDLLYLYYIMWSREIRNGEIWSEEMRYGRMWNEELWNVKMWSEKK
jgi:hypothetical protein